MDDNHRFNVRVYAIIRDTFGRILVCDEWVRGMMITKFPGGGVEWGEGIVDCLARECYEELGQRPTAFEHFYTTEFFQQSVFSATQQIISVYYRVWLPDPTGIETGVLPTDIDATNAERALALRWLAADAVSPDVFTLPIDRHVASLISGT